MSRGREGVLDYPSDWKSTSKGISHALESGRRSNADQVIVAARHRGLTDQQRRGQWHRAGVASHVFNRIEADVGKSFCGVDQRDFLPLLMAS